MKESAVKSPENLLAERVLVRQAVVEKIIGFARSVVAERGKVIEQEIHDFYVTTEAELKDFASFSFYSRGVYTEFGGEIVKIWYRSDIKAQEQKLVFEVEWWDIKECKVKHFDPSLNWLKAMLRLIENRVRFTARIDREKKRQDDRRKRAAEKQRESEATRAHLQREAARLGLS